MCKKKQQEELPMPFIIERDPLYRDGLEKGLERGRKEIKEQKLKIAKTLLKQGIDIEVIVKSTGLLKKEVEKLIKTV